jgi:hypothetical protein
MHVNDSPVPAPGTAGKRGASSGAGEGPPAATVRAGRGFRKTLEGRRPASGVDALGGDSASAAAMAGWFRAESAPAPAVAKSPGAAGVASARAVDRVLIGSGPDGAQARIHVGAGFLAGTEIQLSSTSGRAVEVQLLTHAASSRQTLSVVLDEIRLRLRDRGIALTTRAVPGRAFGGADGPSGGDGASLAQRAEPRARSGG